MQIALVDNRKPDSVFRMIDLEFVPQIGETLDLEKQHFFGVMSVHHAIRENQIIHFVRVKKFESLSEQPNVPNLHLVE